MLCLSILGGFEVRSDDFLITGFKTQKTRALLAYLAVENQHPHRRQALAGLLWPGYLESSARANLRHALSNLRQVLREKEPEQSFILVEGETIQLNPSSSYQLDLARFETLITQEQPGLTLLDRLECAAELYQGDFLAGFSLKDCPEYDNWTALKREELLRKVMNVFSLLADEYEKRGELEKACQSNHRQLKLEPSFEQAHLQLMRRLALRGQRTAALAQYETCLRILREELSVDPSDETTRLYEQIRRGEMSSPRSAQKKTEPDPLNKIHRRSKHNLPLQLTSLIGREREIEQVKALLKEHRLVTLTGSGGAGKTRLAIEVGFQEINFFQDGVWFVDLAPVGNPEMVPQTIAQVLGMLDESKHSLQEGLIHYLQSQRMLLVLDNCEHLLDTCAELADQLLRVCPSLRLLVTSHQGLGVVGEALFRVPSLSYPESPDAVKVMNLMDYTAVRMLVDRVRLSLPNYPITPKNAQALARICRRLDGMPLALELAATRLNLFTAEEVAERLEDAFRLLTSEKRAGLPRHKTLRTTMDWSYNLLDIEEQQLLNRLAVFAGGFTIEGAEAVCGTEPLHRKDILDLLSRLVNKSLVVADQPQGEESRFHLIETVRQYAFEKLVSGGELEVLQTRFCDYYLWLAEQAEPQLKSSGRLVWTYKLILEFHNHHQALEWAFNRGRQIDGLRMICALAGRFWHPLGCNVYSSDWLARGMEIAQQHPEIPKRLQVHLHKNNLGSYATIDKAITLCEHIGVETNAELCEILASAVFTASSRGDQDSVRRYCERCLEVIQKLGTESPWSKANAFTWIGWAHAFCLKDYPNARRYALEGWQLFQQAGDRWYVSHLTTLGYIAQMEGDFENARQAYQEAVLVYQEVRDLHGVWYTMMELGHLELQAGNPSQAKKYILENLQLSICPSWFTETFCNLGVAEVMLSASRSGTEKQSILQRAARLFGAAEKIGIPEQAYIREWMLQFYPSTLEFLHEQLDVSELETAWAEGAAMSAEDVYDYARQEPF
jgi:predicted ATPase/DNA-binding SARP family transcriptional activator